MKNNENKKLESKENKLEKALERMSLNERVLFEHRLRQLQKLQGL